MSDATRDSAMDVLFRVDECEDPHLLDVLTRHTLRRVSRAHRTRWASPMPQVEVFLDMLRPRLSIYSTPLDDLPLVSRASGLLQHYAEHCSEDLVRALQTPPGLQWVLVPGNIVRVGPDGDVFRLRFPKSYGGGRLLPALELCYNNDAVVDRRCRHQLAVRIAGREWAGGDGLATALGLGSESFDLTRSRLGGDSFALVWEGDQSDSVGGATRERNRMCADFFSRLSTLLDKESQLHGGQGGAANGAGSHWLLRCLGMPLSSDSRLGELPYEREDARSHVDEFVRWHFATSPLMWAEWDEVSRQADGSTANGGEDDEGEEGEEWRDGFLGWAEIVPAPWHVPSPSKEEGDLIRRSSEPCKGRLGTCLVDAFAPLTTFAIESAQRDASVGHPHERSLLERLRDPSVGLASVLRMKDYALMHVQIARRAAVQQAVTECLCCTYANATTLEATLESLWGRLQLARTARCELGVDEWNPVDVSVECRVARGGGDGACAAFRLQMQREDGELVSTLSVDLAGGTNYVILYCQKAVAQRNYYLGGYSMVRSIHFEYYGVAPSLETRNAALGYLGFPFLPPRATNTTGFYIEHREMVFEVCRALWLSYVLEYEPPDHPHPNPQARWPWWDWI